jgi:Sulfotransferase family
MKQCKAPREPLFIVGMYKSGTTWLLRILDQHPALCGVTEIDLIRAGAGKVELGDTLLPAKDRLINYFSANSWAALPKDYNGDLEATNILIRSTGFNSVNSIFDLSPSKAIDTILELYALKWKRGKLDWAPDEKYRLLSIVDVPRQSLVNLYRSVASANSTYEAGDAFLNVMYSVIQKKCNLIIKGADLIARYQYLQKWKPNSKKLLIVRDGRDAVISAIHFRHLMGSVKRTHAESEDDYWVLFNAWRERVRILMDLGIDRNLAILRYEDLILNFNRTISAIFKWIGLTVDIATLDVIYQATRFETLANRKRGEPARHLLRRGVIGEWKEALSRVEQVKAWQEGNMELSYLGYSENGEYLPLNINNALLI